MNKFSIYYVIKLDSVKTIVWFLISIFAFELLLPTISFAGGPTQPETQSFTPISVSNLVDPFTGDFNYNLPLMDVEGYPINIAYNAGITMDQEASWVGLGWNLNVGAVDRAMRGLPDEFKGDSIQKITNMKPNNTVGVNFGIGVELFGKNLKKRPDTSGVNININAGLNFNNYSGYSTNLSFGPSFDFLESASHNLTAGFSLSGSSENGASFSPSLSYSKRIDDAAAKETHLGGNIGTAFNTRAGLSQLSYGMSRSVIESHKAKNDDGKEVTVSNSFNTGVNGSFDIGLATYSPSASHSMKNLSLRGSIKLGPDLMGNDVTSNVGISFSSTWLPDEYKTMYVPAYGYLYLNFGRLLPGSVLDFNRDNEGSFSKEMPFIASAHLTNDVFSIKAQGVSGSYKPFRTDVGYVFDAQSRTISHDGSFGVEVGFGQLHKVGFDLAYNRTSAYTGMWLDESNEAGGNFSFKNQKVLSPLTSPFVEASESAIDEDPLFTELGSDMAVRFDLAGSGMFPKLKNNIKNGSGSFMRNEPISSRQSAIKQNQLISYLSVGDLRNGFGIDSVYQDLYVAAKDHHIGEITHLGTDGRRYVFGKPAYNYFQKDVTFATGAKPINGNQNTQGLVVTNDYAGLIDYASDLTAPTVSNKYGLDNYFSSEKKPAYAHSFMLTYVLSDDYIDSDNKKGPTKNDLGSYVKFSYSKVSNYKWRAPFDEKKAYHNEGMRSDLHDDKASYVYGEKELFYVKVIETKNYVAVFQLEDRADGYGVSTEDGGISAVNPSSKLLRKISLYNRIDYETNSATAIPVQEVHFVYSYELCKNYPGNLGSFVPPIQDTDGTGKLTLKEIYFTYANSKKMKQSPYVFTYSTKNPDYDLKSVDRWGNYKSNLHMNGGSPITVENVQSSPMTSADYPYAIQDKTTADVNAAAWNLTSIKLPSGGEIMVEYEADDYQFVQHLRAMKMHPIVGNNSTTSGFNAISLVSVSDSGKKNRALKVKIDPSVTDWNSYALVGQQLYFRCLVEIDDEYDVSKRSNFEYVSGYGKVKSVTKQGTDILVVQFEGEKLIDAGDTSYNPIVKSALQFGRMFLSRTISDVTASEPANGYSESGITSIAKSIVETFGSYGEFITGPNKAIWNKGRMRRIVTQKSWVRLNVPSTVKKLGGGHRVKRILMKDNWNAMAGGLNHVTGQEFNYVNTDGSSSGVASYEPQLGGDENPWHEVNIYNQKKRFAVDDKLYVESPIMESLFPSPVVGYSRVEVKDIVVPNGSLSQPIAKVRGTGKVVKEFFTSKDFPTLVSMTDLYNKTANSFLPLLPKYQFSTVTQGFAIELNDMHGKPKNEQVYAEGNESPISAVNYNYSFDEIVVDGILVKKLKNKVKTIDSKGNISEHELGVKREAVTDFRQSNTNSIGGAVEFNVNTSVAGVLVIVPTAWPSIDISKNRFRSASITKITNRFGIQESVDAIQDGATVRTSNLAFDKETGEVLLTETKTNFEDNVYSLNFPGYWKYSQLGQAYKNQSIINDSLDLNSNGFGVVNDARKYFMEGDELALSNNDGLNNQKGWVVSVTTNGITIVDKSGTPISGNDFKLKVIRSGYRNKQSTSMASIVTRQNPINAIKSNQYKNVLNAGAVEFGQDWKTFCDCFQSAQGGVQTINPYVLGTKGNWRPVRSLTHLTERTQSNYNENTNIRNDGMFMSYTPYYRMVNGNWEISPQNWTFVSEVTQFSPNGMTLETRDALNRYSASTFGFNNTLTTAVGANSKYRQLGFSSFEDARYTNCYDKHFKFSGVALTNLVSDAHTGKTSVRVSAASDVKINIAFTECAENNCSDLKVQNTVKPEVLDIVGGTAPYSIEYEVVSGNAEAQILLPNNQVVFYTVGAGYHEIEYKITDANGCILIKRFSITKQI